MNEDYYLNGIEFETVYCFKYSVMKTYIMTRRTYQKQYSPKVISLLPSEIDVQEGGWCIIVNLGYE